MTVVQEIGVFQEDYLKYSLSRNNIPGLSGKLNKNWVKLGYVRLVNSIKFNFPENNTPKVFQEKSFRNFPNDFS